MKKRNRIIIAFLIIAVSVLTDRLSKFFAVKYLKDTSLFNYDIIKGVFSLTYHENRGAAFGMLSDSRWIFMSVSSAAIIAILAYILLANKSSVFLTVSLSMIAGGGIGNMIDRISQGYVIDFLYFRLIDFPVFNAADISVTVGAALIIIYLLLPDKIKDKQGTA